MLPLSTLYVKHLVDFKLKLKIHPYFPSESISDVTYLPFTELASTLPDMSHNRPNVRTRVNVSLKLNHFNPRMCFHLNSWLACHPTVFNICPLCCVQKLLPFMVFVGQFWPMIYFSSKHTKKMTIIQYCFNYIITNLLCINNCTILL